MSGEFPGNSWDLSERLGCPVIYPGDGHRNPFKVRLPGAETISTKTWTEAVKLTGIKGEWGYARGDWFPVEALERARADNVAANESMFSPNAYKRNDWTPRDKVTFTVEVSLDGHDLGEALRDWTGTFNRRKDAEAAIERAKVEALAQWLDFGFYIEFEEDEADPILAAAVLAEIS